MPDVIEKKWQSHDDLTVTINDAAPCYKPPSNGISDTAALFFIVYVGLSSFLNIFVCASLYLYITN